MICAFFGDGRISVYVENICSQTPPAADTMGPSSVQLHGSFPSVMEDITRRPADMPIVHRCFVIGGAAVYSEVLGLSSPAYSQPSSQTLQRILLTRILSPAFEECDVFMPEFRDIHNQDGELVWEQASHDDLQAWAGFDVPKGVQEEKGVRYEFQMWNRRG